MERRARLLGVIRCSGSLICCTITPRALLHKSAVAQFQALRRPSSGQPSLAEASSEGQRRRRGTPPPIFGTDSTREVEALQAMVLLCRSITPSLIRQRCRNFVPGCHHRSPHRSARATRTAKASKLRCSSCSRSTTASRGARHSKHRRPCPSTKRSKSASTGPTNGTS